MNSFEIPYLQLKDYFDAFEQSYSLYCDDKINNNVKIAIIICTYHREEFVTNNIKLLNNCKEYLSKVFVIDNGKSLPNNLNNELINIIPNENTGGSGGFTRGMKEAYEHGGFTHLYLMDDDIIFDKATIQRAYRLLNHIKPEYKNDWIGFSMFPFSTPTKQFEMGSKWNGIKMIINNHNIDMSKKKNINKNLHHQKYNYSAWWSLIMPIDVIEKYGYPLPFFIKFDDIEYGLRRHDEKIIFANGLGVWHEDFNKKLTAKLEYYLMRNALITNTLHIKMYRFKSMFRYFGKFTKFFIRGKNKEIVMMNKGIKDVCLTKDLFKILEDDSVTQNKFLSLIVCFFAFFKYEFVLLFKLKKLKNLKAEQKLL